MIIGFAAVGVHSAVLWRDLFLSVFPVYIWIDPGVDIYRNSVCMLGNTCCSFDNSVVKTGSIIGLHGFCIIAVVCVDGLYFVYLLFFAIQSPEDITEVYSSFFIYYEFPDMCFMIISVVKYADASEIVSFYGTVFRI